MILEDLEEGEDVEFNANPGMAASDANDKVCFLLYSPFRS